MHAIPRITNITNVRKNITKITIIAKIPNITNQHVQKCTQSQNNKYKNCANKNTEDKNYSKKTTKITNQRCDTGKHNKSLKARRERGFTNVTKIPKITIIAKLTRITKQGSDTGKYNKRVSPERTQRKTPQLVVIIVYYLSFPRDDF